MAQSTIDLQHPTIVFSDAMLDGSAAAVPNTATALNAAFRAYTATNDPDYVDVVSVFVANVNTAGTARLVDVVFGDLVTACEALFSVAASTTLQLVADRPLRGGKSVWIVLGTANTDVRVWVQVKRYRQPRMPEDGSK